MPAGRKTLLDDELCDRLCELLQSGDSQQKIADTVGIDRTTLTSWLRSGRKPNCKDPLKQRLAIAWQLSKWHLLGRVVKGDKKERVVEDADGEILTRTTETHQKAETAIWLLKIRFPAEFGDKPEAEQVKEVKPSRASLEELADTIGAHRRDVHRRDAETQRKDKE